MLDHRSLQCIEGTIIPNHRHPEQINHCTVTLSIYSFEMFHGGLYGGREADLGAANQVLAQDESLHVISLYIYMRCCICKCNAWSILRSTSSITPGKVSYHARKTRVHLFPRKPSGPPW